MDRKLFAGWLCFGVSISGAWIFLSSALILRAQSASRLAPGEKFPAAALQIEPVKADDVAMSPEFQIAIYENLVEEVSKTSVFQHVYRSGDRRATTPDLQLLRITVVGFKHGSEKKREVTTVAGATIIRTNVQLVTRDGHILIDRQVEGKVRLFGGNLNATRDLAKKVTKLIRQTAEPHAMNSPGT